MNVAKALESLVILLVCIGIFCIFWYVANAVQDLVKKIKEKWHK